MDLPAYPEESNLTPRHEIWREIWIPPAKLGNVVQRHSPVAERTVRPDYCVAGFGGMRAAFAAENIEHVSFLVEKMDSALAKDVTVDSQADLERESTEEAGHCVCWHFRYLG